MRIAYVHELEDKVNRLEALLQSLGRRVEEHIQEHDIASSSRASAPYSSQPGYTPHSELSRDAGLHQSDNAIVDSPWQYINGQRDPRHLPEPMSVRSVVDTPDTRGTSRPRSYTASTLTNTNLKTFSLGEQELPPYDLVYNLVDLFFKHINPWSPILDRKTTFSVLFGGSRLTEDDRVLLNAIVATTLRFSSDSRLTPASRKQYHDTAKTKVLFHCLENPCIASMQALAILAIDMIGTACSLQGMNLLGFLSRSIVQLGLGNELTVYLGKPSYEPASSAHQKYPPQPSSWIEEEGRRRLVWMLYILDRYTTISTSSTFTIPDSDLHLRLPCTYDHFSRNTSVTTRWPRPQLQASTQYVQPDPLSTSPDNLGSFSYHCEVLTILSRIHEFLSEPLSLHSAAAMSNWRTIYTRLDTSLTDWLHSLPGEYSKISQLCHSDPGSKISNWIMLHAAFVLAVIRLHSVAAYPASTSLHFQPSFTAMQRCLGAVESLREIAQDTINNSMLDLLGPPFAFSLWTSARLLLVHAAIVEQDVDPKIHFFISTLEAMGQYWQIALTYARTLERIVQEGNAATRTNGAGVNNPINSTGPPPNLGPTTPSTTVSNSGSSYNFPNNNAQVIKNGNATTGNTSHPSAPIRQNSQKSLQQHQQHQPRSYRSMRKRSYEMGRQLHGRREGGWWESSQTITPHDGDVEYLDVFTFFDYPKILPEGSSEGGMIDARGSEGSRESTRTPVTTSAGVGEGSVSAAAGGAAALHGISTAPAGYATSSAMAGAQIGGGSGQIQSPVFAMPVREGDWLGFQPPHE